MAYQRAAVANGENEEEERLAMAGALLRFDELIDLKKTALGTYGDGKK